mmetsp:Transcript_2450/g.8744  ORF Transcript_2450/g.8744 Transcript_2450/m.8744 type:complete len:201 (+) Transcript_2450:986-1588(+)
MHSLRRQNWLRPAGHAHGHEHEELQGRHARAGADCVRWRAAGVRQDQGGHREAGGRGRRGDEAHLPGGACHQEVGDSARQAHAAAESDRVQQVQDAARRQDEVDGHWWRASQLRRTPLPPRLLRYPSLPGIRTHGDMRRRRRHAHGRPRTRQRRRSRALPRDQARRLPRYGLHPAQQAPPPGRDLDARPLPRQGLLREPG